MSAGRSAGKPHRSRVLLCIAAGLLGVTLTLSAQDWLRTSAPVQLWSGLACSADGATIVASSRFSDKSYNPGAIYISTNSGRTWQLTGAPSQYWDHVVCSADGTKLAAVGAGTPAFPSSAHIYLSTNSGAAWVISSAPATNWVALSCSADGSRLAAAISTGPVYYSTDSGATWTPGDAPDFYWQALAIAPEGGTLALSGYDPNVSTMRQVFRSSDAGTHWTGVPGAPTTITAFAPSADGTQWFGAAGNVGVYHSIDSGQTWVLTSAPAQEWLAIACSADGRKVMTAGITPSGDTYVPGPIYASSDSGQTWGQSGTLTGYFNGVACSADGAKWVVAEGGYAAGYIYTLQTPPQLAIQAVEGGVQLSWPASATGFGLQQTPTLGPQACWLPATNSVQLSGNLFTVFIPHPAGNSFYRLAAQ